MHNQKEQTVVSFSPPPTILFNFISPILLLKNHHLKSEQRVLWITLVFLTLVMTVCKRYVFCPLAMLLEQPFQQSWLPDELGHDSFEQTTAKAGTPPVCTCIYPIHTPCGVEIADVPVTVCVCVCVSAVKTGATVPVCHC